MVLTYAAGTGADAHEVALACQDNCHTKVCVNKMPRPRATEWVFAPAPADYVRYNL